MSGPLLHAGPSSTSKADTACPASNTMAFLGLQRHPWAGVGACPTSGSDPELGPSKTLTQSLEMTVAGTAQSLPAMVLNEQARGIEASQGEASSA